MVIQCKRIKQPDTKDHPFSTYAIREYRIHWYAVGYSELAETILTLTLGRIVDIQKRAQYYLRAEDFSQADYFKHSFGVTAYADAAPARIQLSFKHSQASYILTKPLHMTQRTVETDE
jgi:predicted DNA-binding transcriptional regulator YafY